MPQDTTAAQMTVQMINLNKKMKTREELKKQLSEETAKYQKKMKNAVSHVELHKLNKFPDQKMF